MKTISMLMTSLLVLSLALSTPLAESATRGTWSVVENGTELQIYYGSGSSFPQYAVLHRNDSYLRLNYGSPSDWGTSVVLLPALWSGGIYYQGAPVSASWQIGTNLTLSITGTIASLNVYTTLQIVPPVDNSITAQVTTTVVGSVPLDSRPGEAFKPVTLSSMHISPSLWDAQIASADCGTFAIPQSGWIIQPPVSTPIFGLRGGTSAWKANAPTMDVMLDRSLLVTGWVTATNDPNDDNVALWAASDAILPSYSFKLRASASASTESHCVFLPTILRDSNPSLVELSGRLRTWDVCVLC